jgi:exodeoxyribonuclease VII small subunit
MQKTKAKESGFEESLSALERIVKQLESGELPLERALELFEEGVIIARRCQSQLEEVERKVEMLLRERGEIKVIPFELPKDNQADHPSSPHSTTSPAGDNREQKDEKDELHDSIPF